VAKFTSNTAVPPLCVAVKVATFVPLLPSCAASLSRRLLAGPNAIGYRTACIDTACIDRVVTLPR
jgi:hypothetical protein